MSSPSTVRRTDPILWVAIVATVVAGLLLVLFMGGWNTSAGMMGGGAWAWAPLGMVGAVLLVLLIIVVAARTGEPTPPPVYLPPTAFATSGTALQTLDARYARGEISRDEYLRIRQDLEHG